MQPSGFTNPGVSPKHDPCVSPKHDPYVSTASRQAGWREVTGENSAARAWLGVAPREMMHPGGALVLHAWDDRQCCREDAAHPAEDHARHAHAAAVHPESRRQLTAAALYYPPPAPPAQGRALLTSGTAFGPFSQPAMQAQGRLRPAPLPPLAAPRARIALDVQRYEAVGRGAQLHPVAQLRVGGPADRRRRSGSEREAAAGPGLHRRRAGLAARVAAAMHSSAAQLPRTCLVAKPGSDSRPNSVMSGMPPEGWVKRSSTAGAQAAAGTAVSLPRTGHPSPHGAGAAGLAARSSPAPEQSSPGAVQPRSSPAPEQYSPAARTRRQLRQLPRQPQLEPPGQRQHRHRHERRPSGCVHLQGHMQGAEAGQGRT
jgi:hypothetical protein